ncbi:MULTISPECIES: GlsB/YeaQ/YmgE family stress response membrane protein [unclassified Yoonia]|uniref:GlsB/YeaQ/YmgE family stress response membrane protein n=1 Tax=unclassified Yoonia TaxID=2629118 RepID=UPI002B00346C|nr:MULTISPECIES: GlsB/YeaQ/YmgE family stress response membrane protein [unclassified Yoonia]
MGILWIIIIGFVAGLIARAVTPGDHHPSGFLRTTALGIAGAFVASFIGQTLGLYGAGQGAGIIGAAIGAVLVLTVWGYLQKEQ